MAGYTVSVLPIPPEEPPLRRSRRSVTCLDGVTEGQCYHIIQENFTENSNKRIPNRKDSDYFDSYENLYWRPTPWYKRIFNFIYRFLYFITGPKFVVPILGFVQDISRPRCLNFRCVLSFR